MRACVRERDGLCGGSVCRDLPNRDGPVRWNLREHGNGHGQLRRVRPGVCGWDDVFGWRVRLGLRIWADVLWQRVRQYGDGHGQLRVVRVSVLVGQRDAHVHVGLVRGALVQRRLRRLRWHCLQRLRDGAEHRRELRRVWPCVRCWDVLLRRHLREFMQRRDHLLRGVWGVREHAQRHGELRVVRVSVLVGQRDAPVRVGLVRGALVQRRLRRLRRHCLQWLRDQPQLRRQLRRVRPCVRCGNDVCGWGVQLNLRVWADVLRRRVHLHRHGHWQLRVVRARLRVARRVGGRMRRRVLHGWRVRFGLCGLQRLRGRRLRGQHEHQREQLRFMRPCLRRRADV